MLPKTIEHANALHCHGKCPRILILGAGCTGLGAAYRLYELGYTDFHVLERNPYPGGLSASFVHDGFTWDLGGHVQFSHYDYFDQLMALALGNAWLQHVRESYIWIRERFIPYPFQNNLRYLPTEDLIQCLTGLIRARVTDGGPLDNFRGWMVRSFGEGITNLFLLPYNFKVWAHPPELLGYRWVGERVAPVDLEHVIENVLLKRDDKPWGPNSTFRFPAVGGTGAIWKAVANLIPAQHFTFRSTVTRIDANHHRVQTADGQEYDYDVLISTLPLDLMPRLLNAAILEPHADGLRYSTTHIVGLGLIGSPPTDLRRKHWVYYPDDNCPFYRVTVFSNYSPANVPDPDRFWSIMAEVSEASFKPVDQNSLLSSVIRGMFATNLIRSEGEVASTWQRRLTHGYPVPTPDRDEHTSVLLSRLEQHGIYSRGRFGAWRYEVGNQDHTCMQGVELVDRLLLGAEERTLYHPGVVNTGPSSRFGASRSAPPQVVE